MKVPDPPGSGKDAAKGKGVIVRWGLKEARGKTLACKSCPDRLRSVDDTILRADNLNAAYKKVKRNKGSGGVDGMQVDELLPYLREH